MPGETISLLVPCLPCPPCRSHPWNRSLPTKHPPGHTLRVRNATSLRGHVTPWPEWAVVVAVDNIVELSGLHIFVHIASTPMIEINTEMWAKILSCSRTRSANGGQQNKKHQCPNGGKVSSAPASTCGRKWGHCSALPFRIRALSASCLMPFGRSNNRGN